MHNIEINAMKIPDVDISRALRTTLFSERHSKIAAHICVVEKSFLNDSGCFETALRGKILDDEPREEKNIRITHFFN